MTLNLNLIPNFFKSHTESLSHSSPNQDHVDQHQRPQSLFTLHLITLSPNPWPQLRPHSLSLSNLNLISLTLKHRLKRSLYLSLSISISNP